MIKLTSQFDDVNQKLSLATPTCGGCSCCCSCCLISSVAAGSFSARNFGNFVKTKTTDVKKIKTAWNFSFWQPIGLFALEAAFLFLFLSIEKYSQQFALLAAAAAFVYLAVTIRIFKKKVPVAGICARMVGFFFLFHAFVAIDFCGSMILFSGGAGFPYFIGRIILLIPLLILVYRHKQKFIKNIHNEEIQEEPEAAANEADE